MRYPPSDYFLSCHCLFFFHLGVFQAGQEHGVHCASRILFIWVCVCACVWHFSFLLVSLAELVRIFHFIFESPLREVETSGERMTLARIAQATRMRKEYQTNENV